MKLTCNILPSFITFGLVLCVLSLRSATITSTTTGGTWATGSTWVGGVVPATGDAVIIVGLVNIAANITQTAAGSVTVNTGGSITTSGGTITFGALAISSGTSVTIGRTFTVLGSTSVSGTINFGSTNATVRTMTFNGAVILNSGAVWNETATSAIPIFIFANAFTNNATTFTTLTGSHTFSGTGMIGGTTTTSIPNVAITGTRTNIGTLTVGTALSGAGPLTNGNGTSGILNIGGTITVTTLTATAANNLVNYTGAAQTAKVTTYNNLTLSGSLAKTFATTPTVTGVLSMEGTATVVVTTGVVTFGANATLQYNTATARTASTEEWITPFVGSGGIIIKNTGAITTPGVVQIGNSTSVPLNINSGATLTPGANLLTFHGDFIKAGTLTSGSGGVTIAGTVATQSIAGFTTTGTVTLTKASGTATLQGNVNGGPLIINGSGSGTLNLGIGLTHTFTGVVTLTGGTLNGGSSVLNENALSTTAWNGTGSVFSAGTGTVNFGAAGAQTLSATATTFNNLTVSNSGLKTFSNTPTVNGILSMEGTATVSAAPTYGSSATLRYNTVTSRNAGVEWITPFVASGGVIISNSGTITMNAAKVFNSTAPLTVNSGSSLSMSTFLLTLNGNFVNNGGTASGTTGGVSITGTASQSIGAFTTTGTVSMTKTGGTATLTGNVNGAGLTINGSGGTLILGVGLSNTFTGDVTLTAGSLNGGSSTLNGNNASATAWNGTGSVFTANAGTVNFGASGNQTIAANSTFFNLTLSGSGVKTLPSSEMTISGNMAISGSATATTVATLSIDGTLNLGSGTNLTVGAGKFLTVTGALTNNAGNAGLVIKSNVNGTGSLIHNTDNVPATVERYITGAAEAWHFLSSPVAAQAISGTWLPSGTYGNGTGYDLYVWNEPTNCWIYKLNTTTTVNWNTVHPGSDFGVGRGYLYSVQVANPTKEFAGNLNNGTISYGLTISSADAILKGFNYTGNPYPSSVDWSAGSGWSRTDLVSSGGGYDMWIWNPAAGNYGVCNSFTGSGTNSVTRYIAPMQGFFVQATSAGSLIMTNQVRVHDGASDWKNVAINPEMLCVVVQSAADSSYDEVQLQFGYAANQPGATKLFSHVDTAPGLFMGSGGEYYSVRYLTDTIDNPQVPVMFKPGTDGRYTLKCNFDTDQFKTVLLEDRQTHDIRNMKAGPTYQFNASKSDDANRFVLYFGAGNNADNSELPARIYTDGIQLIIDLTLINKETDMRVYDVLGRKLLQQNLQGEIQHKLNFNAMNQVLIVYLHNANGSLCTKLLWMGN